LPQQRRRTLCGLFRRDDDGDRHHRQHDVLRESTRFARPGFLLHLRSFGYEEPEILPSERPSICLRAADGEHCTKMLTLGEMATLWWISISSFRSEVLELLPPSIPDATMLKLLGDILSVRSDTRGTENLRLRLVNPGFSWQELVDLAVAQGLIYPLIWALNRQTLLLPVPTKLHTSGSHEHPTAVFQTTYQQYLERRYRQREQLRGILRALNTANVKPILLKGARYLLPPTAPWSEARDMRDLDILVRKEDAQKAAQSLEQADYCFEGGYFPTDQHLPLLWLTGAPSAVEIHTEALSFSSRQILSTEELWRHAIWHSSDCGNFFTLPDEWQLLVGLLHHQVSDRGHTRRLMALKALWEFASLGHELPTARWHAINHHLASRDQSDLLGSFVAQASRLFGLEAPPDIPISRKALSHASSTYKRAFWPYPLRRICFLTDQTRFGFSRDTMAVRYGGGQTRFSLRVLGQHLKFLRQHYRGRLIRRLTGRGDKFS
jgi:hypothetical protein